MSYSMPATHVFRLLRALAIGGAITLAGCATTGNSFDTTDLRFLQPGHTTLPEAAALLQGEPVNVYRQLDGSAIARWAHTSTLATDAVYFNQELWLAFDTHGRFQRIVKSNNVPHINLYQDGRRVDVPSPQPAQQSGGSAASMSVSEQPGAQAAADSPFSRSAVSYPLGR